MVGKPTSLAACLRASRRTWVMGGQGAAEVPAAWVQHQIGDARGLHLGGDVGQFVQPVLAADAQGQFVALGRGGQRLPVVPIRAVEQGPHVGRGFQPGVELFGRVRHQDQVAVVDLPHRGHAGGEGGRVAAVALDRHAVKGQVHAHVVHGVVGHLLGHRLDCVQGLGVLHPHEEAGLVEEFLLVAEEDGLVAHGHLAAVAAHVDQADGRRGRGFQLNLGLVAHIGTGRPVPPAWPPVSWQRPDRWDNCTPCSWSAGAVCRFEDRKVPFWLLLLCVASCGLRDAGWYPDCQSTRNTQHATRIPTPKPSPAPAPSSARRLCGAGGSGSPGGGRRRCLRRIQSGWWR